MRKLLLFVIPMLLLFAFSARASFPPNNLYIPEGDAQAFGVKKAEFDSAINIIQKSYAPIFLRLGCPLEVRNLWSSGTVNAYADRQNGMCVVEMHGGFGRISGQTKGGLLAVLCHEIGHHIGGEPRYSRDWASCEGQSDYFAQSCMRWLGMSPTAIRAAGSVTGKILARLGGESMPSYSTPDRSKANGIYCSHPRAQCRMDTYLAGISKAVRPECWYNP